MTRLDWAWGFVAAFFLAGCGGGGPASPVNAPCQPPGSISPSRDSQAHSNRHLLGVGRLRVSEDRLSAEIIPLRAADMHLNLLSFLEAPQFEDWFEIQSVTFIPPSELTLLMRFDHPFEENQRLAVFDPRLVFITGADYTFHECEKKIGWGYGLPQIVDADGYTPVFNPTEFSEAPGDNPLLKYVPGKLATGDNLTATLNPFAAIVTGHGWRSLSPGGYAHKEVRLRTPDGPFEFGYAIDACWAPPDPGDVFPPEASCLEPYELDVTIDPGLTPQLGSSSPIYVELFDHQGLGTFYNVTAEAPDLFHGHQVLEFAGVSEDGGYLFTGNIRNELGADFGEYPVLVRAVDVYEDPNFGFVDAWQVRRAPLTRGWARTWGGSGGTLANAVGMDPNRNVYVAGDFHRYVDFDPGFWVEQRSCKPYADYHSDGFLSVFDSAGAFQRVSNWDGYGNEHWTSEAHSAMALAVDATGYAVVGGRMDYGDAYLQAISPDGSLLWSAWGLSSGGPQRVNGLALDASGNIYAVGCFMYSCDFDPGPGEDYRESTKPPDVYSTYDAFLTKLSPSGEYHWTVTWGGNGTDESMDVALDSAGNIYATGVFEATVDFDPGDGTAQRKSNGKADVFLIKFDANGQFQWVDTWGGPGYTDKNDSGNAVAIDLNGAVYVAGEYEGACDFDPGPGIDERTYKGCTDCFVSKFTPNGEYAYALTWGGLGFDRVFSIALDPSGNTLATGSFELTVDFDPGPGVQLATAADEADAFLSKFASTGELFWCFRWGDDADDCGYAVATDADGDAYVTGLIGFPADFDPGRGIEIHLGSDWAFLAKFSPEGSWL